MLPRDSTSDAICELILLSRSRRPPPGYTMVGYVSRPANMLFVFYNGLYFVNGHEVMIIDDDDNNDNNDDNDDNENNENNENDNNDDDDDNNNDDDDDNNNNMNTNNKKKILIILMIKRVLIAM